MKPAAPAAARAAPASPPTTPSTASARFGREVIGYGEVALDKREDVPDAFRALAEKEL